MNRLSCIVVIAVIVATPHLCFGLELSSEWITRLEKKIDALHLKLDRVYKQTDMLMMRLEQIEKKVDALQAPRSK